MKWLKHVWDVGSLEKLEEDLGFGLLVNVSILTDDQPELRQPTNGCAIRPSGKEQELLLLFRAQTMNDVPEVSDVLVVFVITRIVQCR